MLADRVAAAILGRFGVLKLNAKNTGGGMVVLDETTPRTVVDTTTAPTVATGFQPPTQDEMAERIIAALDGADGVTDGQVLGLTLPSMAAGDVVNGAIVLGGTRPDHVLNTGGPFGVNQNADARGGGRGCGANRQCGQRGLPDNAPAGGGPRQGHVDRAGRGRRTSSHTMDITVAPGLTLTGTPGVDPLNIAVPFFPTDTVERDDQRWPARGRRSAAGGGRRPGLIAVINSRA